MINKALAVGDKKNLAAQGFQAGGGGGLGG
jgi:hypothetical protein